MKKCLHNRRARKLRKSERGVHHVKQQVAAVENLSRGLDAFLLKSAINVPAAVRAMKSQVVAQAPRRSTGRKQ